MKLEGIQSAEKKTVVKFKGKRQDKNTVSQLISDNRYSLTEPNQRNISTSIENLGKVPGEKNIKFLLNAAAKNKYSTNIKLQDLPKNNWKAKLLAAATAAAAITPLVTTGLLEKITKLKSPKAPDKTEREILKLRKQLLAVVDLEQINNETVGNIKNFQKNLDYLIISSETTLEHKKYVLERLNYLMSDEYDINPQLKNKKSIVAAELVNDMAINVPGNKAPNIKAVNQKQHGICAAISIVRKKLAYEDKPNYIDSIISELDSSEHILVYDRNALGSNKKIEVNKVPVDFDSALAKGYRIIDASAMHWMQIATMNGENNTSYDEYSPFDKENFDVNTDSFFNVKLEDPELEKGQIYYQALIKTESIIKKYKADLIKQNIKKHENYQNLNNTAIQAGKLTAGIKSNIEKISSNISSEEVQRITSELLKLEHKASSQIENGNKYAYIPNEEDIIKKFKIKSFLIDSTGVQNITEEAVDNILFMINHYHNLTASVNKQSAIKKASNLYEIAGAFRYQIIKGLEEENTLNNIMQNENIPDRETLLLQTIDKLISKLENNSPHSDLIIEQLHKSAFEESEATRENIINGLKELKEFLTTLLTDTMDDIYNSLTIGSRKDAMLVYLENIQSLIIEKNTEFLESYAQILGVKKSIKNVLNALEQDRQKLINGDEQDYIKIFNKYGNKSQIQYISDLYKSFTEKLASEDNREAVTDFLAANNLTLDDNEENFIGCLDLIQNKIVAINNYINQCTEAIRVVDKDGDVLISANPKDVIIRKLENENRIASSKRLRELQTHLDKIVKYKSSDEFQSRQGKIKDKSLYTFSKQEKETLKDTEESIDVMYSYVQKQLHYVRKDMKDVLEELKRIIGINNGRYWTMEGGSGLSTEKQIRILEYMTGRPHYSTHNLKKAFDKIKTGHYSGITASSVYHNGNGWHAQYVADIEPVKINVKDKDGNIKQETREVLFHDNTWGACEKENTWVDSLGLTRTDYSDNRGGTLGYITDDKFRNGNFVDRILSDMVLEEEIDTTNNKMYKKIKHPDEPNKTMQYSDIIMDGKSPKAKSISDMIHDALFIPEERYQKTLKNISKKHTLSELKSMINNIKNSGNNWKSKYEYIQKRIFPVFGQAVESEDDYNKLADNDYLKVVLEKIALKERAEIPGHEADIARAKTVSELSKFNKLQKIIALNSFKYSFAKSLNVVDFLADSFGEKEYEDLDKILENFNIKLSDEEFNTIGKSFGIDKDKYDGSAKTTINLLMHSINKDIKKVIQNKDAQKAVSQYYRNHLKNALYFNKSDLDLYEPENQKIENIIKFIDRTFDPADDEEFVRIYRNIQDMTNAEFKKEILSKVTPVDLGIKNISGYDILKKLRIYDEKAENDLRNTIFFDSLVDEINRNNNPIGYKYNKLYRKTRYFQNSTFENAYRELKYNLYTLNYTKMFNKYKNANIEKYGAYPAYPRIELLTDEYIKTSYNHTIGQIEENIHVIQSLKCQVENYNNAHKLKEYKGKTKPNTIITGDLYQDINKILGDIVTICINDTSLKDAAEAAEQALELEEGTVWNEYIPYIDKIVNRITDFENTSPKQLLLKVIDQKLLDNNINKKAFTGSFIQPKYQSDFTETLNKMEQAMIKSNPVLTEELKNKVLEDFTKYHLLQEPEILMQEYIKSCAKDSENKIYNQTYELLLKRAIAFAKLIEVQDIIMYAISKGVAINAKEAFNKHTLNFQTGDFSMDSDEMISYMVNSLIVDEQLDTALLFIEKLGLGERYVNFTIKEFDFDQMTKILKNSHKLAKDYSEFQKIITPYLDKVQEELEKENEDYTTSLQELKNTISNKAKELSIDNKITNILLSTIKTIEYTFNNNKKAKKDLIYSTLIMQAKAAIVNEMQNKITEKDDILSRNATLLNLINNIMLKENSEANIKRTEINEKFKELAEMKTGLMENLQAAQNSDKI